MMISEKCCFFFLSFKKVFLYSLEREREREHKRGEGEWEREKQTPH